MQISGFMGGEIARSYVKHVITQRCRALRVGAGGL